ncbi:MAG: YchF/TatD family DNA exonuclease [Alphaproteobacteria bacterium]|nr:YchF/TatD family DNA exonuclease [Alphaproteobacteria bacterium]
MLVDSHVNLHSDRFDEDLDEVIARARDAGVAAMLTISDKIGSTDAIRRISSAHDFIWRSVGAHPHYATEHADLTTDFLVDLCAEADVVGVGECGLDYYYEHSPRDDQLIVFRKHVGAAQETGLPLIIHTRDADADMMRELTEAFARKPFTPLLHCYTSGQQLATCALEMGGYVSFSGIITFKNAEDVRAVAEATPLDRLIIETDCPYLAPIPHRGRRCEPAHVVHVAAKLAEIKGVSCEDIETVTTENFFRLFARADRTAVASA